MTIDELVKQNGLPIKITNKELKFYQYYEIIAPIRNGSYPAYVSNSTELINLDADVGSYDLFIDSSISTLKYAWMFVSTCYFYGVIFYGHDEQKEPEKIMCETGSWFRVPTLDLK